MSVNNEKILSQQIQRIFSHDTAMPAPLLSLLSIPRLAFEIVYKENVPICFALNEINLTYTKRYTLFVLTLTTLQPFTNAPRKHKNSQEIVSVLC